MAERRADAGGDGQHRGHAGHDRQLQVPPLLGPRLDRLADRRRHGEDSGVAAGNHGHLASARGQLQRCCRAGQLLPVVGRVGGLAGQERDAVEIRPIAEEIARCLDCRMRLGRELARTSRPEPDHRQTASRPFLAHFRPLHPGTSTMEKYGASSSGRSASLADFISAIVARST